MVKRVTSYSHLKKNVMPFVFVHHWLANNHHSDNENVFFHVLEKDYDIQISFYTINIYENEMENLTIMSK
jgi:hypothetical protein